MTNRCIYNLHRPVKQSKILNLDIYFLKLAFLTWSKNWQAAKNTMAIDILLLIRLLGIFKPNCGL